MRLTLLLALVLTACAGPTAPVGDPAVVTGPGGDETMIDPMVDARYGLLGEALVGDWTIVSGPWESVSFSDDETASFFANDRLMDSGRWEVEEGTLYVLPAAGGQDTYTIEERRVSGMTFTSSAGSFVIERIRR